MIKFPNDLPEKKRGTLVSLVIMCSSLLINDFVIIMYLSINSVR